MKDGLKSLPPDAESAFLRDTRIQAERYMAITEEQMQLQETGADVVMLAAALASLPNLSQVGLDTEEISSSNTSPWGARNLLASCGVRLDHTIGLNPSCHVLSTTSEVSNKLCQAMHLADKDLRKPLDNMHMLSLRCPEKTCDFGPDGLQPESLARCCDLPERIRNNLTVVHLDLHTFAYDRLGNTAKPEDVRRMFLRFLPQSVEELRLGLRGVYRDADPTSNILVLWDTFKDISLPNLKRLDTHGEGALGIRSLAKFLKRNRKKLKDLGIGPFEGPGPDDDLALPWADLFRAVGRCHRLHGIRVIYNMTKFSWRGRQETHECLKRMLNGASLEDEQATARLYEVDEMDPGEESMSDSALG